MNEIVCDFYLISKQDLSDFLNKYVDYEIEPEEIYSNFINIKIPVKVYLS